MADHLVKLVHARDLARWGRFPAYEQHTGKTLAQHRAEAKAREDLRSQIAWLIYARSMVDNADQPKTYRTGTLRSPWPVALPGRRSVSVASPDYPETTFDPDIGRVEQSRLVLPLFMKERRVRVRYQAPDRVVWPAQVASAKEQLARASGADLEKLHTYLSMSEAETVLFISHRWESLTHPDPDGRQLEKLKMLKDCYLIYDYTSFPQDTTTPEAQKALSQVLDAMDGFIENVMVIASPDYMSRGWCLYEYIAGSLMGRIVCDEINDSALVRLRNLVATQPNPPGIGSTHREAVNAKQQLILEKVNAVLPVFGNSAFTKSTDRAIVQKLLIRRLRRTLPKKSEYVQYVGEWKTIDWTEEELAAAFKSELKWDALQHDRTIPIFKPMVPNTVAGAVAAGYEVPHQPDDFAQERYDLDFSGLGRIALFIQVGAGALGLVLLWALFRFVRWLVGY